MLKIHNSRNENGEVSIFCFIKRNLYACVENIGEKHNSPYFLDVLPLRDTESGSDFSQSSIHALTLVLINSKYSSSNTLDL